MPRQITARRLLLALAIVGLALSAISAAILAGDAWVNRTPDSLCDIRATDLDVSALGIDTTVAGGATGSWEWWPTGLACRYLQAGGGYVTVPPGPLLSVILVVLVLGLVAAFTLLIVRAVAQPGPSGWVRS